MPHAIPQTHSAFYPHRALRPSNFYVLIGQNLTGEFMQKIYTASWTLFTLTAEADRVFGNLWCFSLSFPTGCLKWNTAAINSLLWFMAGLFIEFLVGKCAGCSWKSDFGCIVFVFHLAIAGCGVEKSLKRFWPYLIAFKSCISNGKPE